MNWELVGKILTFVVVILIPLVIKLFKARKDGQSWLKVAQIAVAGLSHSMAKQPAEEQEKLKDELKRVQKEAGVHDLSHTLIKSHEEARRNSPEFELGVDVDDKGKVLGGAKLRIPLPFGRGR